MTKGLSADTVGLLGDWVDVDNQLARIAPVLSQLGLWLRFMRDSGRPPRLGVVNPSAGPTRSVRAELTVVRADGPGWCFVFHSAPDALALPLGTNAVAAAKRTAFLLGVSSEGGDELPPAG